MKSYLAEPNYIRIHKSHERKFWLNDWGILTQVVGVNWNTVFLKLYYKQFCKSWRLNEKLRSGKVNTKLKNIKSHRGYCVFHPHKGFWFILHSFWILHTVTICWVRGWSSVPIYGLVKPNSRDPWVDLGERPEYCWVWSPKQTKQKSEFTFSLFL